MFYRVRDCKLDKVIDTDLFSGAVLTSLFVEKALTSTLKSDTETSGVFNQQNLNKNNSRIYNEILLNHRIKQAK